MASCRVVGGVGCWVAGGVVSCCWLVGGVVGVWCVFDWWCSWDCFRFFSLERKLSTAK